MKSRMMVSLLVIALAAAVIGGGTMAWFTDEDVSEPVTFTAGTLMIDLLGPEVTDTFDTVNLGNLNPGDCWEYEFEVQNVGTKSFNWGIYACWQDIIGQENEDLPEGQIALLKARGFGTDPLSDVIEWAVFVGDDEDPLTEGSLKDLEGPIGAYMEALPADSDPVQIKLSACLPGEETGNEYQGSTMRFIIGVKAWQTTNDAPASTLEDVDCEALFAAADEVTPE